MRITLPVESFFHTESECATLASTIPLSMYSCIPNVIAYDSSSENRIENRIGFELMREDEFCFRGTRNLLYAIALA